MFLNNEERYGADDSQGAEVTHEDSVGGDELGVGGVAYSGGDPNGNGVEGHDET